MQQQIDYRIIEKPNLPENKVIHVAINAEATETINSIKQENINIIPIIGSNKLDFRVKNHPDINFLHYNSKTIICENGNILGELSKNFFIKIPEERLGQKYPADVLMNCVLIGNKLICNKKTVAKEILSEAEKDNYQIINVNQGYTKCSVCVLNEDSIITDDESVYKSVQKKFNDVLLVSKGSVKLKGMNYGFIGGCTGKLSKSIIAFNGRVESHPDYKDIIDITERNNLQIMELTNSPLEDIGSIIPLTEFV